MPPVTVDNVHGCVTYVLAYRLCMFTRTDCVCSRVHYRLCMFTRQTAQQSLHHSLVYKDLTLTLAMSFTLYVCAGLAAV